MINMAQPTTESRVDVLKASHAAFNDGDIETVFGNFDEDIEWTSPLGTVSGPAAVKEEILDTLADLLDEHDATYHLEMDTYFSEGDDVAAFGHGILSKEGETVKVPFAQHWRVVDGKLTAGRTFADTATFFGFLGVDTPSDR